MLTVFRLKGSMWDLLSIEDHHVEKIKIVSVDLTISPPKNMSFGTTFTFSIIHVLAFRKQRI